METAKNIWKWFEKWLPYLWGALMFLIITGTLSGLLIAVIKWTLRLLEVL